MSHEISVVNGRAEMFSGNNVVPWHGLGQVVSGTVTSKEAIELAHLDWQVKPVPVTVNGRALSLDDYQGIIRADTGDTLGITKGRYECIQNADCFAFADSLVADGHIRYETAGALRGGKQVWMLAKYDGDIEINQDKHEQWLLLITSHDGSKCLELAWVTVRVVCANTLSLALAGKSNSIKIRHSESWEAKRDEAKRVLGLTEDYFSTMREQLAGLQDKPMTPDDMDVFTRLLYPTKDEKDVPTRTSNMRFGTARLFDRAETGTHGSNRWDALNAVTDYADHYSTLRGQNTRLESSLMGSGADLKQRAFELLTGEELTRALIDARAVRPPVISFSQTHNPFVELLGK